MKPILVAAALIAAAPAFASGGVTCNGTGDGSALSLEAGVSRGMGSALFAFSASSEVGGDAVPEDFQRMAFAREHVAQYWLDGDELRFVLYRERAGDAPHGYMQVTLRARPTGEDGVYRGDWRADVFNVDPAVERTFGGVIDCSVE